MLWSIILKGILKELNKFSYFENAVGDNKTDTELSSPLIPLQTSNFETNRLIQT